ncbi:MAG TPA: VOC family protein [Actinomycetota bacterium]|nr:VOC family protein [Actinomycetota bacterium]
MGLRIRALTFDASHPRTVADFWAAALGYEVAPYTDEEISRLRALGVDDVRDDPSVLVRPPGDGPVMFFTKVPEGKTVKNRLHLDLAPDGDLQVEVERLVRLGAHVVARFEEEHGARAVMRDPEGNEFCVERTARDVAPST